MQPTVFLASHMDTMTFSQSYELLKYESAPMNNEAIHPRVGKWLVPGLLIQQAH